MNDNSAIHLLRDILEQFPQADPKSQFYNDEINGCDAVNFISELVPEIRTLLDDELPSARNYRATEVLRAAWSFIEDVAEDDPERTNKFFALRAQVRGVLWHLDELALPVGYRTSWNYHEHGTHQFFSLTDWRSLVASDNTVLGYQEWVKHQLDIHLCGICLDGVDAIEVAGCREADGIVEVIVESDAEFFSVYTHRPNEGVQCECDFNTKSQALEFARAIATRGVIPVYGNLCSI
ncbi:MAG: hypothetical protein WCP20_16820 [Desulfuromonadales bacterium]